MKEEIVSVVIPKKEYDKMTNDLRILKKIVKGIEKDKVIVTYQTTELYHGYYSHEYNIWSKSKVIKFVLTKNRYLQKRLREIISESEKLRSEKYKSDYQKAKNKDTRQFLISLALWFGGIVLGAILLCLLVGYLFC